MRRFLFALVAGVALAGCSEAPVAVPDGVVVAGPLHVRPKVALNDDPPRIIGASFSSLDLHRGGTWTARIVTTTNVASVEVRTNLFSINVPRRDFGDFAFRAELLDLPPIFVRAYRVRLIARNSAGAQAEEDLPLRIR